MEAGYFESEQHGEELLLVSDQHGVADDGHFSLQCILDGHRRDVLPTSSDDQLYAKDRHKMTSVVSDKTLHCVFENQLDLVVNQHQQLSSTLVLR